MSNNYKLDRIKNAETLSEQKNLTKDLLTTTDFILKKDVLSFFEYGDRIEHPGRFKLNTFVA